MQDAVVSSLAIHHLDGTEKQVLFKDVASILAPGGSFIIADLTEPMDRFGRKHAANIWDEAVRQRSLRGYDQFRQLGWNHYDLDGDLKGYEGWTCHLRRA